MHNKACFVVLGVLRTIKDSLFTVQEATKQAILNEKQQWVQELLT